MADYVKMIEDLADEFGGTMRYDYSGRNMFGRKCVGIDVPILDDIIERLNEMEVDELMGYATDNMGLGYIIYWPKINPEQVVEEDMEENVVESEYHRLANLEDGCIKEEAQENEVVKEEPVAEDKPKMTDKQLSVHYTITSNELTTFTAAELAEVSEYTPRQLAGILSGLSKKGIIKQVKIKAGEKTRWTLA